MDKRVTDAELSGQETSSEIVVARLSIALFACEFVALVVITSICVLACKEFTIRSVVDVGLAELGGQAEEEYYEEAEAGHGSKKEWRLVYVWISR